MAMAKTISLRLWLTLVATLLLALIFSQVAVSRVEVGNAGTALVDLHRSDHHLPSFDCKGKCKHRCGKAGLKKRCLYFCGVCCKKCRCVPPGTYGNKKACPCYANMKNSKGTSKCP